MNLCNARVSQSQAKYEGLFLSIGLKIETKIRSDKSDTTFLYSQFFVISKGVLQCWSNQLAIIDPQIKQLIIVHRSTVAEYELKIDKLIDHGFNKKIWISLSDVKLFARAINTLTYVLTVSKISSVTNTKPIATAFGVRGAFMLIYVLVYY